MIAGVLFLEIFVLFAGMLIWFFTTQKGSAVVITNLSAVLDKLIQEIPPLPNIDTFMWLRIAVFLIFAIAIEGNEDIIKEFWDELFVWIWGLVSDFGQLVVYFADLIVPLYNWYVTLNAQLTTGTYTILAKCQLKTIIESLVHVGEAMKFLSFSIRDFILAPRGAFDIYNTTKEFQTAIVNQEAVLKCACDGISPALGIFFDVIRPTLLANITNETFNVFVALPQTAVLAIPPWQEIPDLHRIFQPLKRVAVCLGKYLDEVTDNILTRILLKPPNQIPVFQTAGYALEGVLGLGEMIAHTTARLILLQPITFNPRHIHQSFLTSSDKLEASLLEVLTAVAEPLNIGTDAAVSATGGQVEPLNAAAALVDDVREAASPLSKSVGYALDAVIGLIMSVIDEIYFVLRGEQTGLTFMQVLQRWDGHWGVQDQEGIRLQEHFFQNIDLATRQAEEYFLVWAWIPIFARSVSRFVNMVLRIILSSEDIVQDKFFHKSINCGYGVQEECSDECMFYFDPDNPYNPETDAQNPCNSLISEWVFSAIEDFSDVLSSVFKMIRPQHGDDWCANKIYPTSTTRCATTNSDFMCATSTTLKEAVDLPLNALRHLYGIITSVFAESGDVLEMNIDDRLCDLTTVLYSIAGNAVAIIPTEIVSANFKEQLTNVVHSIVVLPVELLRMYVIAAKYMVSLISDSSTNWDQIQQNIENELISSSYKRVASSTEAVSSSVTLASDTANFLVTSVMIPANYLINVFDSTGQLISGETNFFTGLAEVVSVLKNALSKELISFVTLFFKVGSKILELLTKGSTDLGELVEDVVLLVQKTLGIIVSIASQILVSILKLLGPIGEFLIFLWKGVCAAGGLISWLTGADFSSVCDAVDDVSLGRRRLPEMQSNIINMTGFDGTATCDLLVMHYNGHAFSEATPLEQITLMHCAEQQALMVKLNAVLRVDMPTDAIYNWKRKYHMGYEAALAFFVYMKHQDTQHMLAEYDRLELPRYYLDLWSRIRLEVPWLDMIDDALTKVIEPVPELTSIYETSKNVMVDFHKTWKTHEMTRIDFPQINLKPLKFGETYQTIRTHHTMAWGLHTDIDLEGPLNCTVADNFVNAMIDATQRLSDYYEGPFVEHALPTFMMWLQGQDIIREKPNYTMPMVTIPTKQGFKDAVMYSFLKCEYEDIKCDYSEQLARVGRITESLWYVLYTLLGMGVVSILTGISIFPILPLLGLIPLAHTWNYRLTCTPNVPDCFFDDTLLWIQSYKPKVFDEYFPAFAAAQKPQCPDNYLWSSVYLLARTPAKGLIEFALYQNLEWYNTFNEWAERTPLHDDCFVLRIPHLAFIPASLYGLYGFSGMVFWAGSAVIKVATAIIPILSTIYALEKRD
tara:strand:- start:271 stop:4383 length:4113 start_codon:yes stop_codon:yes gene_type:complete